MEETMIEKLEIIAYSSKILNLQEYDIEAYFNDIKLKIIEECGHFLISGTECDEVHVFKSGIVECKKNINGLQIEKEIINVSSFLKSIVIGLSLSYPIYSMYSYQTPEKYQKIFNRYVNDKRIYSLSFIINDEIRAELNLKHEFQFTVSGIHDIEDILKTYNEVIKTSE